ncbi:MAG TPA: threonine ammonia-lyase IlvA [Micropruina sp.]|nr:threonine ammonia-lyase IlvA [Micropruina sp.]
MSVSAQTIEQAAERLKGIVTETPLHYNKRLSDATGAEVWLKREDLQPVRSYKLRGAYNLIAQLSDAERSAGVVCASAGNHGQGVAYACARLAIRAQIFVPSTTPRQKRQRMRQLGEGWVELIIHGDTYDEAAALAQQVASSQGSTLVPAFDDERTIAGQGTLAAEIVRQLGRAPDTLIVPVGGGGMLAGCLTWFAERHPSTKVVGAEPSGAASMAIALEAGRPRDLHRLDTFVDGAAVRRVGELTFEIAQRLKPHMFSVPEGKICSEMVALYQSDGVIAEPAGALACAALGIYRPTAARVVVAIVSGGNNDLSRYAEIEERALVYEGRKHYFMVNFPQEPGALRRFLDSVLGPDDDITLFEYVKRSNRETGPALVGIELGDKADLPGLLQRMSQSRITVEQVPPDSMFYRFLV